MGSGKRPLSERFLRMLIDIHDDDSGIDGRGTARTVTETRIERVVFQALNEIENGSSAFADEREVVQRQRKKRDENADDEGDAMPPPRQKQFVEDKCAPPLPEPFSRSCHCVPGASRGR